MPSHEDIIDRLVASLHRAGALQSPGPIPWQSFGEFSRHVHTNFDVPSTTLTPAMRRLLFALAYASNGDSILGIGTYVGYVIAWLVGGVVCRTERTEVIGVDPDDDANRLARRNLSTLHGITRLKILDAEAKAVLPTLDTRFDIVLLDLDSPLTGKLGYVEVLEMAAEWLPSGALVVAHDASVPRFADDFVAYHSLVNGHPRLRGPWVLAVDECGLSVAVVS